MRSGAPFWGTGTCTHTYAYSQTDGQTDRQTHTRTQNLLHKEREASEIIFPGFKTSWKGKLIKELGTRMKVERWLNNTKSQK